MTLNDLPVEYDSRNSIALSSYLWCIFPEYWPRKPNARNDVQKVSQGHRI